MPLTPEDVSNKRFTPVRLREGYDMGEVDQFLDEVETELARLLKENDGLRAQVASGVPAPAAPAPEQPAERPVEVERPVAAEPAGPMVPATEVIQVSTSAEASRAAAKLLELATTNAETVEAQARAEAERILAEAKSSADELETESVAAAERVEADARSRAQRLDAETAERRGQLMSGLDQEKERLNAEVEGLRSFEREYRARLKSYFHQQLESLERGVSADDDDPEAEDEARLADLLGDSPSADGVPVDSNA
jgi:DivIVA domain-containing protein